jgi:hypothetical protein
MIFLARTLCRTNWHSITVKPFEQIHSSGDSRATIGEERAANQRVPHHVQNSTKVGPTHDSAASPPLDTDSDRLVGAPTRAPDTGLGGALVASAARSAVASKDPLDKLLVQRHVVEASFLLQGQQRKAVHDLAGERAGAVALGHAVPRRSRVGVVHLDAE